MDWGKVVTALDNEWWNRHELAQRNPGSDGDTHRMIANLCFVFRDILAAGLIKDDQ